MQSSNRTLYAGLSIISILLVVYFLMNWQPERYEWTESYDKKSEHKNIKKPYDISIIYGLLDGYMGTGEFTEMKKSLVEELPLEEGQNANYVYIGHVPNFDSAALEHIFEFAETGNTVFIASNILPQNFIDKLFDGNCQVNNPNSNIQIDEYGNYYFENEFDEKIIVNHASEIDNQTGEEDVFYYENEDLDTIRITADTKISKWYGYQHVYDTVVHVNFFHPTLFEDQPIQLKFGSRTNKRRYDWNYINSSTFCHEAFDYAELSYIEDFKTNYIKIAHGEGTFLIHTTPMQFTDYQLVKEEGLASANKTFTHLAEGDIYFDYIPHDYLSSKNFPSRNSDWTPLEYILSQPPLKWAWYLLLSTIGFYLFFRAKRKQQIVPVLETKENSSLEYIKTVGRLYFLQNDHKKLAAQKMKLFLRHVRNQYSIPTNEISTEMKDRLAGKAQVPIELVEEIFTRYKRLQREELVSNSHLTNFHFAVEEFYKKSK